MKIKYSNNPPFNIRNFLMKIGYHQHDDSFVSPLGSNYYPRFHIYIKQKRNNSIIFDLHLDQKQASYKGTKAHMGESNSDVVKEEAGRIKRWLVYIQKN